MKTPTKNKEQIDPSVQSRRKYHKIISEFHNKWISNIMAISIYLSFFILLLPVLYNPWLSIIEKIPPIRLIFNNYTNLNGLFKIQFYTVIIFTFIKIIFTKKSKSANQFSIDLDTHPISKKDEIEFLFNFLFSILTTSIWFIFPFGLIAHFILTSRS